MSPLEYMREYRLRKACMELIETEKSITEIASDCGFGSSSYFGKLFRPSDEKKARMMRVSAELLKDIKEGKIRHMIVKEDQAGYKEKDILTLLAFRDGRSTGEQMRVCITCADDAQTSSAIIEGYAVIGIMDVYDAEALGLIDLEDED